MIVAMMKHPHFKKYTSNLLLKICLDWGTSHMSQCSNGMWLCSGRYPTCNGWMVFTKMVSIVFQTMIVAGGIGLCDTQWCIFQSLLSLRNPWIELVVTSSLTSIINITSSPCWLLCLISDVKLSIIAARGWIRLSFCFENIAGSVNGWSVGWRIEVAPECFCHTRKLSPTVPARWDQWLSVFIDVWYRLSEWLLFLLVGVLLLFCC